MAFFKPKAATTGNKTPRNMPTEFVEVVSYDLPANEIVVRRIEKGGEEVRVGFVPEETPRKHARPETGHFCGKIKKPRDMTVAAGGILKLNRQGVTEDLTNGKLMVSWVDAWVRNPSEEFVFKGTGSVTYLAEKEGLRPDNTRGFSGLMTVLYDHRFQDISKGAVLTERIWKGEQPVTADSSADLATKIAHLVSKGLAAGVRFVDETATGDANRLAAAVVYPKHGHTASDIVSTFISNLDEDALSRIGDSIRCEVIPAVSLRIGNDTAGELLTGVNSEGKASHLGKVRELMSEVVEGQTQTFTVPKFMDAGVLVRVRVPTQGGDAYLSIENMAPLFGKQSVGIANAILAATTENSPLFAKTQATKNDKGNAAGSDTPDQPDQSGKHDAAPAQEPAAANAPADDLGDFFGSDAEPADMENLFGDAAVATDDLSDIFGSDDGAAPSKPAPNRMR